MTSCHYPRPTAPAPVAWRATTPLLVLIAALLTACSSSPTRHGGDGQESFRLEEPHYAEATALSALSNDVLMRAIGLVGTPYRYGGNTPAGGFDCSGLVGFVFLDAAGLALPRGTGALIALQAPSIDRDDLQPGDLVFFNPGGGRVSHIGIYVGEGRFVHAPSAGGTVRLDVLGSDYWERAYQGAKRVLR